MARYRIGPKLCRRLSNALGFEVVTGLGRGGWGADLLLFAADGGQWYLQRKNRRVILGVSPDWNEIPTPLPAIRDSRPVVAFLDDLRRDVAETFLAEVGAVLDGSTPVR